MREHRGELLAAMLDAGAGTGWRSGCPAGAEPPLRRLRTARQRDAVCCPRSGWRGHFHASRDEPGRAGVDDDEWSAFLAAVHEWSAGCTRPASRRATGSTARNWLRRSASPDVPPYLRGRSPAIRDDEQAPHRGVARQVPVQSAGPVHGRVRDPESPTHVPESRDSGLLKSVPGVAPRCRTGDAGGARRPTLRGVEVVPSFQERFRPETSRGRMLPITPTSPTRQLAAGARDDGKGWSRPARHRSLLCVRLDGR